VTKFPPNAGQIIPISRNRLIQIRQLTSLSIGLISFASIAGSRRPGFTRGSLTIDEKFRLAV